MGDEIRKNGNQQTGMRRVFRAGILISLGWVLSGPVSAQLLDDIDVRTDQGVAEIRLRFTAPVRYIKHFPAERGELIKLYLQVLSLEVREERDTQEYKRTPSIPLVPPFTVVYSTARSCFAVRDPLCLDIQFNKPVRFNIRQGADGRSILLFVLPDIDPRQPAPQSGR
jgi:hypothetical protein